MTIDGTCFVEEIGDHESPLKAATWARKVDTLGVRDVNAECQGKLRMLVSMGRKFSHFLVPINAYRGAFSPVPVLVGDFISIRNLSPLENIIFRDNCKLITSIQYKLKKKYLKLQHLL